MCDKPHYDELCRRIEKLEDGQKLMREDMMASVEKFVTMLDVIKNNQAEMRVVFSTGKGVVTFFKFIALISACTTAIGSAVYMITHWKI